jgi:tRNA-dihydrouridine synthase
MGFSGHSYWERIAVVKKQVSIPVVGNGDVVTADDAMRMLETTGCDSVMIGRGAFGNPWLFSQIKNRLAGKEAALPSARDRVRTALDHIRRFTDAYGERKALAEMKKHASWYTRGLSGAAHLRSDIFGATSTSGIELALLSLLSEK